MHKLVHAFARYAKVSIDHLVLLEIGTEGEITREAQLEALMKGLTQWALTRAEGREAWDDSSSDFNVGDLMPHIGDAGLTEALKKHGVLHLDVLHQLDHDPVSYDKVLMNAGELDE